MKKWLLERFLPMWAKETVLKDNRRLAGELRRMEEENARLQAYIRGLREGVRVGKRGVVGTAPYNAPAAIGSSKAPTPTE